MKPPIRTERVSAKRLCLSAIMDREEIVTRRKVKQAAVGIMVRGGYILNFKNIVFQGDGMH